jgi:hypothetical protein
MGSKRRWMVALQGAFLIPNGDFPLSKTLQPWLSSLLTLLPRITPYALLCPISHNIHPRLCPKSLRQIPSTFYPVRHLASNCTILPAKSVHRSVLVQPPSSPLCPLLIQHAMSALLAPNRITSLQRDFGIAVTAQVVDGGAFD